MLRLPMHFLQDDRTMPRRGFDYRLHGIAKFEAARIFANHSARNSAFTLKLGDEIQASGHRISERLVLRKGGRRRAAKAIGRSYRFEPVLGANRADQGLRCRDLFGLRERLGPSLGRDRIAENQERRNRQEVNGASRTPGSSLGFAHQGLSV
ncbi:MAG TPA: hypothetical protein VF329_06265 [Gammaproteobacteria bacterium]